MKIETSSATWTKLRDGFGLRVIGVTPPRSGQTLTVTKRDGGTSTATVSRVIWSGPDKYNPGQTVHLCTVERTRGRDSHGNRIGNGDSYRAGVTAPHGRKCPYCGSRECDGAWGGLCDQD